MAKLLSFLSFLLMTSLLLGQGSLIPLRNPAYHIVDRLEVLSGRPSPIHLALQGYQRGSVAQYALQLDTSSFVQSKLTQSDLAFIFKDNNEWLFLGEDENRSNIERSLESPHYYKTQKPIWKALYKTPANFLELNKPSIHVRLNPMLNSGLGYTQEEDEPLFLNQRGLEFRGRIDDKVYIYSNIIESQARFPNYVNEYVERNDALPGNGLIKEYENPGLGITNGYDFLNAQGYFGINITRHIGLQFGHGRHFLGHGMRSIFLSDFANNYFYLKLNTRVWKFHLQNIFAELTGEGRDQIATTDLKTKKYIAAHYLSFKVSPAFSFGFYESVVFSRNNQFELQYLNPVIFYRSVEGAIGSPDNVNIGLSAKLNLFKTAQLYSHFIIDEFVYNELIIERRGWWGNKYGFQAGIKYFDALGVDHLDLQLEANIIRPYTYTHRDSAASYTHDGQALAHPLGANFREVIASLRYQPHPKWLINGRLMYAEVGEDDTNQNWGNNILLSYNTRVNDYGNDIAQGVEATIQLARLEVSYQLFHNAFLSIEGLYRKKDSQDDARDLETLFVRGTFRLNFPYQPLDF